MMKMTPEVGQYQTQIMETQNNKRKIDFSIDSILYTCFTTGNTSKRQKTVDISEVIKSERPESPSSTTNNDLSLSCSSSFPQWTQCQRDGKKSRRPYSRQTVTILSWWFHHLPFLTVEEMEVVGRITELSRQQVKVWWQNRRHSQRGRSEQADPYLSNIVHLPLYSGHAPVPEPGSGYRQTVFNNILNFYLTTVRHVIMMPMY